MRITTGVLAMALSLGGCGTAPDSDEGSDYIEIAGVKMRKTGSTGTALLWAGVKRDEGRNGFDPKFLPLLEVEIDTPKVTEAFNQQTKKTALEAAAKANIEVGAIDTGGSVATQSTTTGTFHVFRLFRVDDFVGQLNSPKNRSSVEGLMRYENPRIITSIATVFTRSSNNAINAKANASLKVKNPEYGNPEFTIKAETSGETLARLSDGTVFAYEYARVCWERVNGVVRVATLEVDRPGPDDNCPRGTTDDARELMSAT